MFSGAERPVYASQRVFVFASAFLISKSFTNPRVPANRQRVFLGNSRMQMCDKSLLWIKENVYLKVLKFSMNRDVQDNCTEGSLNLV